MIKHGIEIKEIKETTAKLFKKDDICDHFVCDITSELQLYDIRVQIKEKKLKGFYISWNDYYIKVDRNGNLSEWPDGFFDCYNEYLLKLI